MESVLVAPLQGANRMNVSPEVSASLRPPATILQPSGLPKPALVSHGYCDIGPTWDHRT